MSISGKYVCAFRGRRDYYQVPLALAEGGLLEEFITDAYCGPMLRSLAWRLPGHLREKAHSRFEAGLPDGRVRSLWTTTAIEHLRHRLGFTPSATFAKLDRNFSLAAASRARSTWQSSFSVQPVRVRSIHPTISSRSKKNPISVPSSSRFRATYFI